MSALMSTLSICVCVLPSPVLFTQSDSLFVGSHIPNEILNSFLTPTTGQSNSAEQQNY